MGITFGKGQQPNEQPAAAAPAPSSVYGAGAQQPGVHPLSPGTSPQGASPAAQQQPVQSVVLLPIPTLPETVAPIAAPLRAPCMALKVSPSQISYDPDQKLGKGTYGTVYRGVYNQGPVAVKVVRLKEQEAPSPEYALAIAMGEVELQCSLEHPNVVSALCYAVATIQVGAGQCNYNRFTVHNCPNKLIVVQPLMGGGSLDSFLGTCYPPPASFTAPPLLLRFKLLLDLVEGLVYMHQERDMLHGDIKPANVLLNCPYVPGTCNPPNILLSPLRAALCDFGTAQGNAAKMLTRRAKSAGAAALDAAAAHAEQVQFTGSPLWMDPQSLSEKHCNRKESDIYSMGIVAWQILTCRVPYHHCPPEQLAEIRAFEALVLGKPGREPMRPSLDALPDELGADLKTRLQALLKRMWHSEQDPRPTILEVRAELRGIFNSLRLPSLVLPKAEVQALLAAAAGPGAVGLGKGSFGAVYKCSWRGVECALKVCEIGGATVNERITNLAHAKEEVELQSGLVHPNIVPILGYAIDSSAAVTRAVIVQPLMHCSLEKINSAGGGSGGGALLASPSNSIARMRYLLQIAEGVEYVHRMGLLHGDLKPANVLLSGDGVARISDFGTAMKFSDGQMTRNGNTKQYFGTCSYMDPQVLTYAHSNRPSSDVYSLGIVAWELLSCMDVLRHVHPGLNEEQLKDRVMAGLRPALALLPSSLPDASMSQLLTRCWNKDQPELYTPAQRQANVATARPCAVEFVEVVRAALEKMLSPQTADPAASSAASEAPGIGSGGAAAQPAAPLHPVVPSGLPVHVSPNQLPGVNFPGPYTPSVCLPVPAVREQQPPSSASPAPLAVVVPPPTPPPWSCSKCTFVNDASAVNVCIVCSSPRPDPEAAVRLLVWPCPACTLINDISAERCAACLNFQAEGGAAASEGGAAASEGGGPAPKLRPAGPRDHWACLRCTMNNPLASTVCSACELPKALPKAE